MNVTLSIDYRVVGEARRIAALRGTPEPAHPRNEMTQADEAESAVAQLEALWAEEDYRSADPWTREELHERSTLRRPFES